MTISIITPWAGDTAHLLPEYKMAVDGAEVITVDNASSPATAEVLRDFHAKNGGLYIRNETNQGFSGANNQGYKSATQDIIIFLNSDVRGPSSWLQSAEQDVKPYSLYGPEMNTRQVYGILIPFLSGWCIAATRNTWEHLKAEQQNGPWDTNAYPDVYWEDNDLSLRALNSGVNLYPMDWDIQHKSSGTIGPSLLRGESFERNRATFAARVKPTWEAAFKAVR